MEVGTAEKAPGLVGLRVVVVGLPRTGTASVKRALEHLGYGPCFHLVEPPTQFGRIKFSADILNTADELTRQRKLAQIFDGFEVALEQPASSCLPDILAMYPGIKVILTERSSASMWLDSWRGIGLDVRSRRFRWAGWWMPGVVSSSDLYRAWVRLASERCGVAPEPSEELYHAHSRWVREIVPSSDLLVYRHEMGWGPLCEFLGRQPDVENLPALPRTNERGVLRFYKQMAMLCGLIYWFFLAFVLLRLSFSLYNSSLSFPL